MKRLIFSISVALFLGVPVILTGQVTTVDIYATQGYLNELIDGSQANTVYRLVSLDTTYKFTDAVTVTASITIMGVVDPVTGRPPAIQPAVLQDASIPPTVFSITGNETAVAIQNLYLLAKATNNVANADGVAIQVSADNVRLSVDNSVFDGWQAFAIGYNGNWDSFFITDSHFRNMVHPNQWYIGEVIRNEWPGEAYTDTLSMVGNRMIAVNGYAAAPVTKFYMNYFEFVDNKVVYTFKNPFFIFNATEAKINNNIFYGNYAGGVDQTEHPWWDNLWEPDSTYGVIAFQPLDVHNSEMFNPDDPDAAEEMRTIEVNDNVVYWPSALTDFWSTWNSTAENWIHTPVWMNHRTVDMFADNDAYPNLEATGNVHADPGFDASIDEQILNGTTGNDIGLLAYFEQVRSGTAATDVWGYAITQVDEAADWVPIWPLPEARLATNVGRDPNGIPENFVLRQNYPNPFNPSTTIEYLVPQTGTVVLKVYNLIGQEIATLVNEVKNPGTYRVTFDASRLASGLYFYRMTSGAESKTMHMMLVR